MHNPILVPVDGSSNSLRALQVAVDLARQRKLPILLLHVVPPGGIPEGLRQWAEVEHVHEIPQWLYDEGLAKNLLDSARNSVDADTGVEIAQRVASGDAAKCIIDTALTVSAPMILMGSRGMSDFAGLVLGSVAHRVAHGARCSVITVT